MESPQEDSAKSSSKAVATHNLSVPLGEELQIRPCTVRRKSLAIPPLKKMMSGTCITVQKDSTSEVTRRTNTRVTSPATAGMPSPLVEEVVGRDYAEPFFFVERPSEDYFCPVTFELLVEPQLTSCCGHHLSLTAVTRMTIERKPCPMCNGREWGTMLDKSFRRKVHELRLKCPHSYSGCEWVGEMNYLKRHADVCEKRLWECQYCALKCTYGEGEEKHWSACLKFPEPCPNRCEVGSVERCNMEQHRSVCSLEPVACEMKEFGCSVVVPRKELATHMRESELQHLTAMTVLNLRLSRQLQQDSTERDRKITQLQQEMADLKKLQTEMKMEIKTKLDELTQEIRTEQNHHLEGQEQKRDQMLVEKLAKINTDLEKMEKVLKEATKEAIITPEQLQTEIGEQVKECLKHRIREPDPRRVSQRISFAKYSLLKESGRQALSDVFYSHRHGYEFGVKIHYQRNAIAVSLSLFQGEFDDQLDWPVEVKIRLQLLNQAGSEGHVSKTCSHTWKKEERGHYHVIAQALMTYSSLEKTSDSVNYTLNDNLEFRVWITVFSA